MSGSTRRLPGNRRAGWPRTWPVGRPVPQKAVRHEPERMDKKQTYRQAIDHLEKVVEIFEHGLGRPRLIHGVFAYKKPTVKHACFLKALRIVSGLNALLVLLEAGFVTEMGVVMRTMSDCINDIYFMLENFPETTPEVDKYLTHFFTDGVEEPVIAETESKKTHRTKIRKIHASRARQLSEYVNFPIDRDMVYRTYSAYSGYVHAGYPSIMELYGGPDVPKFSLEGVKEGEKIRDWNQNLLSLIRSAILVFGFMAEKYYDIDLIERIRVVMDWFEKEIEEQQPHA